MLNSKLQTLINRKYHAQKIYFLIYIQIKNIFNVLFIDNK